MAKRVPEEAKIIGRNLRNMRKSAGFSQAQMGKSLGVSFQQLQKYERGENRLPVEKLYLAKHLLGSTYGHFFEGMPQILPAKHHLKKSSSFPEASVLHSVDTLQDMQLKRKIEKMIEIMLA